MIARLLIAYATVASLACAADVAIPVKILDLNSNSTFRVDEQPVAIVDGRLPLPLGKAITLTVIQSGKSVKLPPIIVVDNTTASAEPAWSLDAAVKLEDGTITAVGFFESARFIQYAKTRASMAAHAAANGVLTPTQTGISLRSTNVPAPGGGTAEIFSSNGKNMKVVAQETVITISADFASVPALREGQVVSRAMMSDRPTAGNPIVRYWVRNTYKAADLKEAEPAPLSEAEKAERERSKAKADALLKDLDRFVEEQREKQ